jgi:hypothetical protein
MATERIEIMKILRHERVIRPLELHRPRWQRPERQVSSPTKISNGRFERASIGGGTIREI